MTSYEDHLNQLGTITLENRRHYNDIVFVYKALHGMADRDANDFGFYLKNSCSRGQGIKLQQRMARTILLHLNYLQFERRPHGISSP